ncbi:MHO_1580 family protein [Mycoplasma sp. 2634B]|uniref:MHO_1580 family protein n=1 Tax=Mycoplasma sp. 2634B TaxID=3401692 RepID=UPI003AB01B75
MINIDYVNQNDTYIVNERRLKVNTLVANNSINGFAARFAINIDRIASNNMADITVAFEDGLYDYKNKLIMDGAILSQGMTPIPLNILDLIKKELIKRTLNIHVAVYINKKVYIEFDSNNGNYKKQIKRVPYSSLKTKFSDLDNIIVQFSTKKPLYNEQILLKEYQLIFEKDKKETITIVPYSNTVKLRIPYSYNINFESGKKYWKELYYHNLIFTLEDLDNKTHHNEIISSYQYNDKKIQRFPGELNFNEYIPISFNSLILKDFMDEKINLITKSLDSNNVTLDKEKYYEKGRYYKAKINDLLYTDELNTKIWNNGSSHSSYSVKIPYKFDGDFNGIYEIACNYFDLEIIKKFSVVGTNEHDNLFNKRLKIIEIAPLKNIQYKYLINLELDYTSIFSEDFNIQDYLIIEENEKRKFLN